MTDKRGSATKIRRKCFEYWRYQTEHGWRMRCRCGCEIEFNPATEAWEAEHLIPSGLNGSDDPPNVRPFLSKHQALKTKKDVKDIAKAKRVSDQTYGVRRASSSLRKPPGLKWNWDRRRYERSDREVE